MKVDGAVVEVLHHGENFAEGAGGDQESAAGAIGFDQFGAIWAGLPHRSIWSERHMKI